VNRLLIVFVLNDTNNESVKKFIKKIEAKGSNLPMVLLKITSMDVAAITLNII